MATATTLLQQQQQHQQQQPPPQSQQSQEHNIELMCRICAVDFKIASEGVPIFNTEQLMDKIQNYLHIQLNNLDKLSHLVCNECVRKIENFHCYAMMAHKNQELFSIMYSEKIYREHCTALSSLNTTLYREPPTPLVQPVQPKSPNTITIQPTPPIKKQKMQSQSQSQSPQQQQPQSNKPIKLPPTTVITPAPPQPIQQHHLPQQPQHNSQQQPVAVLSTEDITIFTYQDLKLGQVIKDQELQKLILRALKWNEAGKPIESQLERLKNASFRGVLNNPDLLRDEDLVQLLGPYLDHGSFAPMDTSRPPANMDFSTKMLDQNVTEMEVGVDPDLFFPFDDEESKGIDVEVTKVVKPKKERKKSEARSKAASKKTSTAGSSSVNSVLSTPPKIRIKTEGLFKPVSQSLSKNSIPIPKPVIVVPTTPTKTPTKTPSKTVPKPKIVSGEMPTVKVVPEATLKQNVNIEKPVIVQSPPPPPPPTTTVQPTESSAAASSSSTEVSTTTPSTAKTTSIVNNSDSTTPSTVASSVKSPANATVTNSITSTVNTTTVTTTTTATTPVPAPVPSTPAAAAPAVAAVGKPTPKISTSKAEPRVRQARNLKADQSGPKTRARSIFNTRHKCAVCGKRFATSGNLKAHVKTHKPKGKFNCDKCGRVFKTQINLQRHKEYHSGEKFSCRTCGRVYPSNSTLKQHEISHSSNRPHKCNICMKTFKRSQDLKFHINQHTGDRPYQCPFCPKAFASSGNCFSHRKRVHSDKSDVPVPATTTTGAGAAAITTTTSTGGGSKRTNAIENAKKLMKA